MRRVLLIEDDHDIRENTTEMLELSGFEVVIATNGEEGVQELTKVRPDVILCDIKMPQLDGYSVLTKFKEIKEIAHVPFIFFSASVERKEVEEAFALGIDGYIRKPFDYDELINTINQCLKEKLIN
jgi:CheY-like chemotaxis protein